MDTITTTTRREFGKQTLGALLTFSLLETLFARDLFAQAVKPIAAEWIAQMNRISQDLKGRRLTQVEWQTQIEQLFSQVELPELLKLLDFNKLTANVQFPERGERSLRPQLPQVEGLPTDLVFGHQIFALQKDRSVVPHGHNNMATAFLILGGEFHGRHYDRLEDDREHMVIRPTIDRAFSAGEHSSISDEKDNVHWFQATSDVAYIFNIHVLNLSPDFAGGRNGRIYIDPNGEKLSDSRIRARKIKTAEAFKLYG